MPGDASRRATSATSETATATLNAIYWTGLAMVSVPLVPNQTDPGVAIDFSSWMRYNPATSAYVVYGSAADNANVKGVWQDGTWTVTWVRPLNLANAAAIAVYEAWRQLGHPGARG